MITIRKPLSFTEIGRKDNQEDYLYPSMASKDTRVFIMCDGMGGHDKGEVASMTAANALGDYLTSYREITIDRFNLGLATAYDALDEIDTHSSKKPGTTLTCLCLNDDSYLVAHIGDSRIYHIRPSLFDAEKGRTGMLYQSSDHSLVNDLLKAGEITEEEARDFPQKNIITRAMQPHLERRYKADVFMFDDIEGGDYFFLCSDGVLERLSNEELCRILAEKKLSDEEKLAQIKAICDGNTRDNYTCWLVPVDKVNIAQRTDVTPAIVAESQDEPAPSSLPPEDTAAPDGQPSLESLCYVDERALKPRKGQTPMYCKKETAPANGILSNKMIRLLILLVVVLAAIFFMYRFRNDRNNKETKNVKATTETRHTFKKR